MSADRDRVIDAAVRGFGANLERAQAARVWFGALTEGAEETDLKRVADRWERDKSGTRRRYWRKVFLIGALVLAIFSPFPLEEISDESADILSMTVGSGAKISPGSSIGKGLSKQELLLLGDPSESHLIHKTKLWRSAPDNPAYFADYAVAYQASRKALPPDYFETAARIDPENAWFDYFGAAVISADSVVRLIPPGRRAVQEWKIVKPKNYTEALRIFIRAGGKARCQSYETELLAMRIRLLPQSTPVEREEARGYISSVVASGLRFLKLGDLVSARAVELEAGGDVDGFRELRDAGAACIRLMAEDDNPTMVHALVVRAVIEGMTHRLEKAGRGLGVAAEAPWISEWRQYVVREKSVRQRMRENGDDMEAMVERYGSNFISTSLPPVLRQAVERPPISAEDLKPGRMQDYANVSVVSSVILYFILGCAAVAIFAYRFRAAKPLRIVAARVEGLLAPADWIWIFGAGVLLPVMVVFGLMVFTPLGGWDQGMQLGKAGRWWFRPLPDFVILCLLMIILPVLVSRWRLASCGAAAFGVRSGSVAGWTVCALLGLGIGCAPFPEARWIVIGLLSVGVLWVVGTALRAVFSGSVTIFPKVIVSRAILPAYLAGGLCMMVAIVGFGRLNRLWFEQDGFMTLRAEEPSLIAYEYRLTRQMRTELRQLIGSHR